MKKFQIILNIIGTWLNMDEVAEAMLDALEAHVMKTGTKIDDVMLLPVIRALRATFTKQDQEAANANAD